MKNITIRPIADILPLLNLADLRFFQNPAGWLCGKVPFGASHQCLQRRCGGNVPAWARRSTNATVAKFQQAEQREIIYIKPYVRKRHFESAVILVFKAFQFALLKPSLSSDLVGIRCIALKWRL